MSAAIIMVLSFCVLLSIIGGGGAYWWFVMKAPANYYIDSEDVRHEIELSVTDELLIEDVKELVLNPTEEELETHKIQLLSDENVFVDEAYTKTYDIAVKITIQLVEKDVVLTPTEPGCWVKADKCTGSTGTTSYAADYGEFYVWNKDVGGMENAGTASGESKEKCDARKTTFQSATWCPDGNVEMHWVAPIEPGCYIKASECAQEWIGDFDKFAPTSDWGYQNKKAHKSAGECQAYANHINGGAWCGNPATPQLETKFVSMPTTAEDLTDEQAACYKARYSKLTGDIPAVKAYWKLDGFTVGDYPYCRANLE